MGLYSCNAVLNSALPFVVSSGSHHNKLLYYSPRFLIEESPRRRFCCKCNTRMVVVDKEEKGPGRFNWVGLTEEQEEAITRIPVKMSKRCQALMKQIICCKNGSFSDDMLGDWVRRMKPIRADWLSLLKELNNLDSPFYIKVDYYYSGTDFNVT